MMSSSEISRDIVLINSSTDKNYAVVANPSRRYTFTSGANRQLTTQVSARVEPSTSLLDKGFDLSCNNISASIANKNTVLEGSFGNKNGEQVALNHGERINYRHPNDISSSHSSTNEYYIASTTTYGINSSSTINYYTNSIVNSDTDKIIFDGTCTRRERRTLISISGIYDETSGSIAPCASSSLVVHNNRICKDEDIGIISVRGIIHQLTNTNNDSIASKNDDNNSTATTNANYNGTRHELSSDDGEGITTSIDCNCTTISITVGSNILHRQIDYIHPSYHTHNKSVRCTVMHRLLSIVNNNIYNTLIGYDWTRDTIGIGRVSGRHSTSILLYRASTLHSSEMIYDVNNMTASLHNDGDIEDHTHQDGEHRIMSMHISGFDLESDSMTAKYNILSLENDDVYRHGKVEDHENNTQCDDDRFTFECKNIRVVNGTYKCTGNTTYNSLAIRTGSWIVLIMSYTHTALHQLESIEHKIVCNRLDGRGVTNVEHLGNINIWGTHPISVDRKGIYDLVGIKQTHWKVTCLLSL